MSSSTAEPSGFSSLFEAAVREYETQTRIKLTEHPLSARLKECHSVHDVTKCLEDHTQAFRKFRGNDGKVAKLLRGVVHVLHTLSTSSVLGEGVGLVRWK